MKVVYIAGPISRGDLVDNIRRAHDAGLALLRAGLSPIVPHGSAFWGSKVLDGGFLPEVFPGGTTHEDWMGVDLPIVRRADAVLRLEGLSRGADLEVIEALKWGIPVFYEERYGVEKLLAWAGRGFPVA